MHKHILTLIRMLPIIGEKIRAEKDYLYSISAMDKARLHESGELAILQEWERLNPSKVLTPEVVRRLIGR